MAPWSGNLLHSVAIALEPVGAGDMQLMLVRRGQAPVRGRPPKPKDGLLSSKIFNAFEAGMRDGETRQRLFERVRRELKINICDRTIEGHLTLIRAARKAAEISER